MKNKTKPKVWTEPWFRNQGRNQTVDLKNGYIATQKVPSPWEKFMQCKRAYKTPRSVYNQIHTYAYNFNFPIEVTCKETRESG